MAMRGSSVRGTPVRHIGTSGTTNEGVAPGRPSGMKNTVHPQYEADHRGYQTDPRSGTPYNSQAGNSDEFSRTVSSDKYGHVIDDAAGNMSDPASNGAGVVLDGADSPDNGNSPRSEPTMDSPVPGHAPVFNPADMVAENRAHLGSGNEIGMRDLIRGGGVMSRGMDTVSQADNTDEDELLHDDVLNRNIGRSDI
jgi:hypothetical protein